MRHDDYMNATRLLDRFTPRCYEAALQSINPRLDEAAEAAPWGAHRDAILTHPWHAVRAALDAAEAYAQAQAQQAVRDHLRRVYLGVYDLRCTEAHLGNWERNEGKVRRQLRELQGQRPFPTQKKAILELAEAALRERAYPDSPVELKVCELRRIGERRELSLVLEVGRVGDEGTLAHAFARDRWHFFVGDKGALRFPNKGRTGHARNVREAIRRARQ